MKAALQQPLTLRAARSCELRKALPPALAERLRVAVLPRTVEAANRPRAKAPVSCFDGMCLHKYWPRLTPKGNRSRIHAAHSVKQHC